MKLAPTRCLRSSLLALFLAVTALSASAADMVPLGHTYPRINLTNGRILKNVVLNGFNREAGLIYVLENRQLKPYPLALFPGFVTNRINSTAAEHPAPAIRRPSPSAPARSSASPAKCAHRARHLGRHRRPGRGDPPGRTVKAEQAARRHFRYQIKTGSGYATVTGVEIDLSAPESVPGWSHRYRVIGDGFYSYYESVGGSFHRRTRGVEILLEASHPDHVKVLEITTIWGRTSR